MSVNISILAILTFLVGKGNAEIKYADLGYDYQQNETFFFWPSQMFTRFRGQDPNADHWYIAYVLSMGEHGGTHIDAPYHMCQNGWSVDEIPLDRLLNLHLLVVDLTSKVEATSNYQYSKDDFIDWEKEHGIIPKGSVVFVKSDWSKNYPDRVKFTGMKTDSVTGETTFAFPGFHEEAAEYLSNKGVYGVGTESASLDHATIKNFPAHLRFCENDVWGLENLRNMDGVPETGARVSVLPLKTRRGSGGPSRVIVTWDTVSGGGHRCDVTSGMVAVLILAAVLLFNV